MRRVSSDGRANGDRRDSGDGTRAGARARSSRETSRRAFLKLVAAGSAAIVGGVVVPAARGAPAAAKRRASGAAATLTPAMRKEIANQKGYVARALKTIREYPLPPGSEPGLRFHPLRPSRRRAR